MRGAAAFGLKWPSEKRSLRVSCQTWDSSFPGMNVEQNVCVYIYTYMRVCVCT